MTDKDTERLLLLNMLRLNRRALVVNRAKIERGGMTEYALRKMRTWNLVHEAAIKRIEAELAELENTK